MASQARVQQPPWQTPPNAAGKALKIFNSLTRTKTPFAPVDPSDQKVVTWYACGPTVYDDAHVGHARNYVTTDIIRRIMRDYFEFNVKFVMNITDVDDKIIGKARQLYLFNEFADSNRRKEDATVKDTTIAALSYYLAKHLGEIPHDLGSEAVPNQIERHYGHVMQGKPFEEGKPVGEKEAKIQMHVKTVLQAVEAIDSLKASHTPNATEYERIISNVKDIVSPYLDSLYGSNFDASNHEIFDSWARNFEKRFNEDMQSLNVLEPDKVTRVTEYMPRIVDYAKEIERKGFAYKTTDGSLYFDIKAFEAANNAYARLEPWSKNNTELQADGEGALTKQTSEKRSDADFALWKSSKPGEPSWESPWGFGRPGWHIECSAMASDEIGRQIDIHSGGIDLAFPHHDNELAQAEAYYCDHRHATQHQWVNYFIHMGHLHIGGAKMSKSLKNFVTIREMLSREDGLTSRGLRIIFLLGGWKEQIEVTELLRKEASGWEDKVNNFFIKVLNMEDAQDATDQENGIKPSVKTPLAHAKETFHNALLDSFNTSLAMRAMSELISKYNSLDGNSTAIEQPKEVARWLTQMVSMFGLNGTAQINSQTIGWSGLDIPEYAKPYLSMISSIRDRLRQQAQKGGSIDVEDVADVRQAIHDRPPPETPETIPYRKALDSAVATVSRLRESKQTPKSLMIAADQIRDEDLWNLGVYLEDKQDSPTALIRPVTKELREAKMAQQVKKSRKTTATPAAGQRDKRIVRPQELFKTEQYSEWNQDGLPTKDKAGEPLTQTQSKKLQKQLAHQQKLYDRWQSQQQAQAS
ncbi:MAG: hypothetical protein Q9213_002999 [Squamulea squamosa]